MDRAVRLACLSASGAVLGAMLAWIVPTQVATRPNAQLAALSQPDIVRYPAEAPQLALPDSYPVTYSPQWLAVKEASERQRMVRYNLPEVPPPLGYDQPSPEHDLAVERASFDTSAEAADELDPDESAAAEPPAA